jgi:hypothetical protein
MGTVITYVIDAGKPLPGKKITFFIGVSEALNRVAECHAACRACQRGGAAVCLRHLIASQAAFNVNGRSWLCANASAIAVIGGGALFRCHATSKNEGDNGKRGNLDHDGSYFGRMNLTSAAHSSSAS